MRVSGNTLPETIHLEPCVRKPGLTELRLRENIHAVTQAEKISGLESTLYVYDEYLFRLPQREGLKDEIEENLPDWLATGRILEVNPGASIVTDLRAALDAIYTGVI